MKTETLSCSVCKGWGYVTNFNGKRITVKDCKNCNGKGEKEFPIIDNRKLSKKADLTIQQSEF